MTRWWERFFGGKRLNGKAILILTLVAILFGGGAYFLHGFQVRRNADGLLEQAKVAEDEGKKNQVIDYLQQYRSLAPGDIDASAKLGLLLSDHPNPRFRQHAYFILDQEVLLRDPGRDQVRRAAIRLASEMGRFSDGKEHLLMLQKSLKELDAELLQLSARCEFGLHNDEDANFLYREALSKVGDRTSGQPDELKIAIALEFAGVLRRRQAVVEANSVIGDLIAQNSRSEKIRLGAASYFARYGMPDKAWTQLRFILDELGPPSADVLALAGDVALGLGKGEDAQKFFEQGRKLHPKDRRMSRGLAQIALQARETEKAISLLEDILKDSPREADELAGLAVMLLEAGADAQARKVVTQLSSIRPGGFVRYLDARLLMREGKWGQAAKLLDGARTDPRFTGSVVARHADLLLAECHTHLMNPDQRLVAVRRAVEFDPSWPVAQRELALALAATGKGETAIGSLRKLAATDNSAKLDLARLLVEHNLRLPEAQRNWAEVTRLLDDLPLETRATLPVKLLRAQILAVQGRRDEARTLVEAERDRDPKQVAPWLFLAALAEAKGTAAALDLLSAAEKQVGPRVDWQLMRARLALRDGADKARPQLLKLLEHSAQLEGQDRDLVVTTLADAFASLGDMDVARRLWSEVAGRMPENLPVRFRLFEAALRANDVDTAGQLLKEMRRLEGGEGAFTAYGEGAMRARAANAGDKAKLTEARTFLARAASLRPTWSRVPLMEAVTWDLEGQKEKAIEKYRAALDLGEGRLHIVQRVLLLMQEQRQFVEANALLRKLPELAQTTPELGRLAAQLTLFGAGGEGQDAEAGQKLAMDLARKTALASKDHRDHLWLGQIASLAQQPQEAEKAFRRACELKGTAPECWTTLILFLARSDVKQAEAELARAQQHLPKEQVALVLAIGSEAIGQAEKAAEHFQALLKAQPNDPTVLREVAAFHIRQGQGEKAEKTLRTLLEPDMKASELTTAWARRQLAMMLATQGDYQRFKEAETLLKQAGKEATREDRLTRAMILATRPAHRRQAIQTIEGMMSPKAMPDDVRFLLAQLYEMDGNWPAAEGHLLAVLRAQEKNPKYLDRYVSGLLRQGEIEAAEVELDKLVKAAPEALRTLELRINVLKSAKKTAEALRFVRDYANKKDARLELTGQWLELLGEVAEAEKTYRAYVAASKIPESPLVLAGFLARQRRLDEALAICDRAWDTCPPGTVAAVSVHVLRVGQSSPAQQRHVEQALLGAISKHPDAKMLPSLLAEIHELKGDHIEAMRVYRKALKDAAPSPIVQNNLAYLLAVSGGDGDESLKLIDAAMEVMGPHADLLDTRAVVQLRRGRADLAIQDLQQALVQRTSPGYYCHLARAHKMAKNLPEATRALRNALDAGLKLADVHPLERPEVTRLAEELSLDHRLR